MKPTQKHQLSFLKKLIGAFIAIFGMTSLSFAATHTVDNKTGSTAQYTTLQDAVDAASAGDIILVAGSATAYSASVDKQLEIIGEGYKPNKQIGTASKISTLTLVAGASSTEIKGFDITTTYINANLTNLVLDRCYLGTVSTYYGSATDVSLIVRNCIFSVSAYTNAFSFGGTKVDLITQNTIIYGNRGVWSSNASSSLLFDHCLFISNALAGSWSFTQCFYLTVTNSVLVNCTLTGMEYQTFTNNIISNSTDPIYGTGTGGNNQLSTDPLFEDNGPNANAFNYSSVYKLQATSTGKSAASDGTDIGIYGGSYPFPVGGEGEYLMAASPRVPQIYEMNVLNAAVPENGTLSIQVKARKID